MRNNYSLRSSFMSVTVFKYFKFFSQPTKSAPDILTSNYKIGQRPEIRFKVGSL